MNNPSTLTKAYLYDLLQTDLDTKTFGQIDVFLREKLNITGPLAPKRTEGVQKMNRVCRICSTTVIVISYGKRQRPHNKDKCSFRGGTSCEDR